MPLILWNQPHWELLGRWNSVKFFHHLPTVLPDATTLYVEGTSFAGEVEQFFRSAAEPGEYLPKRQTLWPRPQQYRLRCDGPTLAALEGLANRYAEPELLNHLFVYNGSSVLMEFPDAFDRSSPAYLSQDVAEQHVRNFAASLGVVCTRVQPSRRG